MRAGLEEKSDQELCSLLQSKASDNEALSLIVKRHSGIFYKIVHHFFSNKNPCEKQDVLENKLLIIYLAAMDYDGSKNTKLSTFIGNKTRYFCLNYKRKKKRDSERTVDLDEFQHEKKPSDPEIYAHMDKAVLSKAWTVLDSLSDKRIREIFKLRYTKAEGNKLTPWHKINKRIKKGDEDSEYMSVQGCINLHAKGLEAIKSTIGNV